MNIVKNKVTDKVLSIWGIVNEFSEPQVQKKAGKILRGDFLKTDIIARNLGLIILCLPMLIVYVSLRYYVEDDIKQISQLQKELEKVRIESITRSSELMKASKRSSVVKSVKERGLGLKESDQPPLLIK